jgi:adenylate cyclase
MKIVRILFVIILSGAVFNGYSQHLNLKMLVEEANARKDDTVKVNLLLQICDSLYRTKPEETITYATRALELSNKLKFKKGEAYADKYIGMGYFIPAQYVKAFDYFQQALDIFELIQDKKGVANMLNSLGTIYNNQGNDAKALEFYLRSLSIGQEISDSVRILTAQINVGIMMLLAL